MQQEKPLEQSIPSFMTYARILLNEFDQARWTRSSLSHISDNRRNKALRSITNADSSFQELARCVANLPLTHSTITPYPELSPRRSMEATIGPVQSA